MGAFQWFELFAFDGSAGAREPLQFADYRSGCP